MFSMNACDLGERAHTMKLNAHLFEQMRGMHRAWLEKLREIRDLELDYGSRIMAAKNSSEAVSFCSEWMVKRMAIVAHEQRMFASSWARLLADMRQSAVSAGISKRDS
jgi:hypothetical protein